METTLAHRGRRAQKDPPPLLGWWAVREDEAVEGFVDAASDGFAAAEADALAELLRASPARVAARLLPWLSDPRPRVAHAVRTAALSILRAAPARSLWAVDRELRGGSPWLFHGIPPAEVAALASGPAGLGALALLTMQRNGYTRETAVSWLASVDDPLALRLLLLRLNDPVPRIVEVAEAAVLPWLDARRVEALVGALPLLEAMAHTVRAARTTIAARAESVLLLAGAALRRALRAAIAESADEDVRRLAVLRLAEGSDEEAIAALRQGLDDRSPRVRLATARWLGSGHRSPAIVAAVLPWLERSRSPHVRLLSLRLRRDDGSPAARDAVLSRCLDGNAVVRYHARCQLRARGSDVDFRALALRCLEPGRPGDELVGALAVLSDIGRREDIERVRAFLEHPVRRVCAEARRTLDILEQG